MCAIFGLIDYGKVFTAQQRELIVNTLARECEVRGTDATGFAYNRADRMAVYKRPLSASFMWVELPKEANVILGHTRMATQGKASFNPNNHPFLGKINGEDFALAHNGILRNDLELARSEKLPYTKIQTDSYVAVQLLEQYKELSLETLSAVSEKIDGTFVFTLLDRQNNSYFVRGDNPLSLLHCPKYKFYIYASTKDILQSALEKLRLQKLQFEAVKTECGDILKIDNQGAIERTTFDTYLLDRWEMLSYYHWWGDDSYGADPNSTYIRQLKEFANTVGVAPDDIDMLLECGYDLDEIEELIYDPPAFQEALSIAFEDLGF